MWDRIGGVTMEQVIMETSALKLPSEFAKKIGTKRVMIRIVDEGLLLVPVKIMPQRARGMLKGTGFSTERFLVQKQADKELEG